jgi:hypothetical protein
MKTRSLRFCGSGFAAAVAAICLALIGAPAALADGAPGPYNWTGGDSGASATLWSNTDNWQYDQVPTGTVNDIGFPALYPGCPGAPASACFDSVDDLGPLTVPELFIDDSSPYVLSPQDASTDTLTLDAITIGTGNDGIDAYSSQIEPGGPATIDIPILLGDNQKWEVDASHGGLSQGLSVAKVSGNYTLEVDLDLDGWFFAHSLDTGALTMSGDSTGSFVLTGAEANLPTAGVTLENGSSFYDLAPDSTSGAVVVHSVSWQPTSVVIGNGAAPDTTLGVTGSASFDENTALDFDVDENGSVPSTDYSRLTATGAVTFAGASIEVDQGENTQGHCVQLGAGNSYTLISSTAGLSGTIDYVDASGTAQTLTAGETSSPIAVGDCSDGSTTESAFATLSYTGTALTVTIIGGNVPTLTGAFPTISGSPAVGSTLQATTGGWDGSPTSYDYFWLLCSSSTSCDTEVGNDSPQYSPTDDDVGDAIEVCVDATNSYGNSDYAYCSAATSKVPSPPDTTPVSTGTPSGGLGGPVSVPPPYVLPPTHPFSPLPPDTGTLRIATHLQVSTIRSALNTIGHPSGKQAAAALIKSRTFSTSFPAPSAGGLHIVWTTTVTTGTGKQRKRKTVVIASGSRSAVHPGRLNIEIHLTGTGETLLKKKPSAVATTARETFDGPGAPPPVSVTKTFSL